MDRLSSIVETIPETYFQGIKKIEFNNRQIKNWYGVYRYNYRYNHNNKIMSESNHRIMLFNSSYLEDDKLIKCVLLHEIGHHKEDKIYHNTNLSERFATEYAISKDPICEYKLGLETEATVTIKPKTLNIT